MSRSHTTWIQETLRPALAELSDALSRLDAAAYPFEEARGLQDAMQLVQRLQRESRALATMQTLSGDESKPALRVALVATESSAPDAEAIDDAASDDAIDFARLAERCLDDQSFLRQLLLSFRAQLEADLREAELLQLGRHWTPLTLLAGRSLGTAENMSAGLLSEAWRLCRSGTDRQSAEETEAAVALLQVATTRTTLAIDQWLVRHQPRPTTTPERRADHADSRR